MRPEGAYTAERAAALSGVPKRTVHYWASEGVVVPTVSPERIKVWSYSDLVALRVVHWLRHEKYVDGRRVKAAPMPAVRQALASLRGLDPHAWDGLVAVDHAGRLILDPDEEPTTVEGQGVIAPGMIELLRAFEAPEGTRGPDLRWPRPRLRIIPGKLAGEPHVARSRVETRALAALARRGMGKTNIARLYPYLDEDAIEEALDLERQLDGNLSAAAA